MTKGSTHQVLVIPDIHDGPSESKRRWKWIARFATDIQPNAIIQIGDLADFDSLCTYVSNASHQGKTKPTFDEDLKSLAEALSVFEEHLDIKRKDFIKHVTLGNHEYRAWRYEDEHPETFNTMANRLTDLIEAKGWTWTQYGEYYNYQGVDFTHVPLNHMGKPIGGKYTARSVANEVINDTVFGHTHKFYDCRIAKAGSGNQKVRVVETGCAMEWDNIKDYAKRAKNGWWWGVLVLTIHKGRIEGVDSVPMFKLQKKYN